MRVPEGITDLGNQKTTPMERGDWFVPIKEGIKDDSEPVLEAMNPRRDKVKKVIKTILLVLGVAVFLYFGYLAFHEFYR